MRLDTGAVLGSSYWGGYLAYNSLTAYNGTIFPSVTIPLYIKTVDQPIRVPKITEVNTIPTIDPSGWSDGTAQAMFFGGNTPLTTTLSGFLLTPATPVIDSNTNQAYMQVNPTSDGTQSGTNLNLLGYTYGDLIWVYLEGKMARVAPSAYMRIDPAGYIDPNGNYYGNPIIAEFNSTKVPGSIKRESFTMKLYLET